MSRGAQPAPERLDRLVVGRGEDGQAGRDAGVTGGLRGDRSQDLARHQELEQHLPRHLELREALVVAQPLPPVLADGPDAGVVGSGVLELTGHPVAYVPRRGRDVADGRVVVLIRPRHAGVHPAHHRARQRPVRPEQCTAKADRAQPDADDGGEVARERRHGTPARLTDGEPEVVVRVLDHAGTGRVVRSESLTTLADDGAVLVEHRHLGALRAVVYPDQVSLHHCLPKSADDSLRP